MKTIIQCLILASLLITGAPRSISAESSRPKSASDAENLRAILDLLRSDTNPFKIRTLNQVMALTGPEAEVFWPIYQEYESKLSVLTDRGMQFIRDFLELQATQGVEQKSWNDLAKRWLKIKENQLDLWRDYQKEISRKVSPYRAAQFLQVEHELSLFTDLGIASEMPVITQLPLGEDQPPVEPIPTREESVMLHVVAKVEAIDHDKREVTLKGPLGNSVTVRVDEHVQRLGEINAGDTVSADYYVSVAAELRPPTAEERGNPLVILEGAGKSPPGTSPAGGGLRQIKAVCTIEGLDRPTETVTVKGPLGRYASVRTSDPANLPHLKIGDTVLVTYTEAFAVALEELPNAEDAAR